ncbi:MAG: amidohydrolase family protein [Actinobacteria bacterium]|nr:amidohydrolase family protein [Actinomycetota bacterium]
MYQNHNHEIACCSPNPVHSAMASHLLVPASAGSPADYSRPVTAKADFLVRGRIATGVPGAPEVDAMAISGGVITGLGSAADVEGLIGPGTEIVNAGEGVISPGLVEPHMHLWTTMLVETWPDLSALANPTFDDVVATLKAVAAQTPDGQWVRGKLFDPSLYEGEPNLTRDILDQIAPNNPVFVLNASMHFGYVNSKALAAANVDEATAQPSGGTFEKVDGKLTGVLSESGAIVPFLAVVPQPTQEEAAGTLFKIMTGAAAMGVTSMREAATGAVIGVGEVALLHQLNAAKRLPTRISTAQWALLGDAAWKDAGVTPFSGDAMVRADAWKIVTDGSNQGRSGYFQQPYLNETSGGHTNMTPEELRSVMNAGLDAGWQLMVHTNGDAAVEFGIAAYADTLAGRDTNDLRHRLEHCSFAHEEDFVRLKELGVSPSFLMNHVYYWGEVFQNNILGPERANRLDMVASALKAGLRPSLHSDYNVTPIHPLLSAKTAVKRVMLGNGEVLNANESVSAEHALKAITVDAAWQIHADDRGTLEVGKRADYAVLSDNPWTSDVDGWDSITCLETRIDGEIAYQA